MLYLASTSPRRKELLQQIGLEFECLAIDVDESVVKQESPQRYVARLSKIKADAGLALCEHLPEAIVIAADTTVVIEEQIIGKPQNLEQALVIWRSLSGKKHTVLTGVTIASHDKQHTQVVSTDVYFRELSEQEMTDYWHTGEAQDKAGGYGIQGKGTLFVEKIVGSYSNVVGLPLTQTALLLRDFGVNI
jgi:septum formation protein